MNARHADADNLPKYTPEEIAALRAAWNLSAKEFGELLGFKDAARTVAALEYGEWHGKPYRITGTAMMALKYLAAIKAAVDVYDDRRSRPSSDFPQALLDLAEILPKRMRA